MRKSLPLKFFTLVFLVIYYWISLKIAKDSKVMTDPIDDRKFQEVKNSCS